MSSAKRRSLAAEGSGLIICATGNLALKEEDFALITNGAYVASVTSSDDELELTAIERLYTRVQVGPHITRYARTGHYFYMLADGNAVNFLHGASVGDFIFLVQAEILAALGQPGQTAELDGGKSNVALEPGIHELASTDRSFIMQLAEIDGYAWRPLADAPTAKLAAKIAILH